MTTTPVMSIKSQVIVLFIDKRKIKNEKSSSAMVLWNSDLTKYVVADDTYISESGYKRNHRHSRLVV